MPLVYDTGASRGLTPFKRDFLDYQAVHIPIKDIKRTNYVIGVGTVVNKMIATDGSVQFVPSIAYHMPDAAIRLHSPQTYYQQFGVSGTVTSDKAITHAGRDQHGVRRDIEFPINRGGSNIPLLTNVSYTKAEKDEVRPYLRSFLVKLILNFEDEDLAASSWHP